MMHSLNLREEAVKGKWKLFLLPCSSSHFIIPSQDDSGLAGVFSMRVFRWRNGGNTEKEKLKPMTDIFIFLEVGLQGAF